MQELVETTKHETVGDAPKGDDMLTSMPEVEGRQTNFQMKPDIPLENLKDSHYEPICDEPNVNVPSLTGSNFYIITKYPLKYMCQFMISMIALFGSMVGQFAVPGLIGVVVDVMSYEDKKKRDDEINYYAILMLFVVIGSAIFTYIRAANFNILSDKIARDLRYDMMNFIVNKEVTFFDHTKTGDILSRISADTSVIQDGLSTNISMFVRSLAFIIATLVVLFIISWKLTIVTLAGIMPLAISFRCYGHLMRKTQKIIQDSKAELNQIAEEAIGNIRTVKAFSTEHIETKKYKDVNDTAYNAGYDQLLVKAIWGFWGQFALNASLAGVVFYGAYLKQEGEITIGNITGFLLYMMQLLMNFFVISIVFGNVFKVLGASGKMIAMMRTKCEVNSRSGLLIPKNQLVGQIELRNVKFTYPTKSDVKVCDGINLTVAQGQVVALVGHSGCGKSSIIQLIQRYYDPHEGQILFGGVDLKKLDPIWFREQVSIVAQEPALFKGTIRDNICYGLVRNIEDKYEPSTGFCGLCAQDKKVEYKAGRTVSQEDLDRACKMANCYNFIMDTSLFPDGYDTVVGERGMKLSGGQKQRIAIARALVRKPKILLLDEATSALDSESESLVQKSLDHLIQHGGQTVILIAHRLSTVRNADKIVVIDHGKIVEEGSHDELVAMNGKYMALVSRQMEFGDDKNTSPSKAKE